MAMQAASTEIEQRTAEVIAGLKDLEGPLLPILHDLQQEFGYVPRESLPLITQALNLSRADAYGGVRFYPDSRKGPAGRHVLQR